MNPRLHTENWPGVIVLAWALIFALGLGVQAGWRAVRRRLGTKR